MDNVKNLKIEHLLILKDDLSNTTVSMFGDVFEDLPGLQNSFELLVRKIINSCLRAISSEVPPARLSMEDLQDSTLGDHGPRLFERMSLMWNHINRDHLPARFTMHEIMTDFVITYLDEEINEFYSSKL